ncbi:MAG: diaminopimelate epimerase [Acidobacteria bacterium]|jgi:diaminopimelate epimerase|nr:diaminopimelate epimerase [Acidobacteriota bacterium]
MIFYKTSSRGNDFIAIDARETAGAGIPVLVRGICDRQRGVGADGVVFYRVGARACSFQVYNRDGGAAELSGNGMAGLAAVLLQRRLARSPLDLRAAIGRRRVVLAGRQGPLFRLDVEIGAPDFAARGFFPFLRGKQLTRRIAGVDVHPVSVGNPHAVVICRHLPTYERLVALGKRLEGHPLFPRRVNVEFVEPLGAERCRVFFYERGVGPTQASSTGSAAVFAVLRRLATIHDRLRIEPVAAATAQGSAAQGDPIQVRWQDGIHVDIVTRLVCRGEYFPGR